MRPRFLGPHNTLLYVLIYQVDFFVDYTHKPLSSLLCVAITLYEYLF